MVDLPEPVAPRIPRLSPRMRRMLRWLMFSPTPV